MDFANINLGLYQEIAKEILFKAINSNISSRSDFEKLRNSIIKKHKSVIFHNLYFIKAYQDLVKEGEILENELILSFIQKRSVRTMSGVAPVTVLTKPYFCPGKCIYCPTDLRMPKSYLPSQPAAQRAYRQSFNPYTQVFVRLKALFMAGHDTSKIELRVIGGTFSSYPNNYKKWFIKRCLMAMNDFSVQILSDSNFTTHLLNKITPYGVEALSEVKINSLNKTAKFSDVVKDNEFSLAKCIGINVETRPDFISEKELKYFRELGVTKVEMGVQTLYDNVQKKTGRGHLTSHVVEATKLLKNAGFKVGYHMMPNLPFQTPEMDKEMFKTLFSDQSFFPDYLKIYPCVVIAKAKLSSLYRMGDYEPYSDDLLVDILTDNLKNVPYMCRVDRIARDIPADDVESGLKTSNIRQVVENRLIKEKFPIAEIRFREIKGEKFSLDDVELLEREYKASGGTEYFLSFEDLKNDKLIALLRLRISSTTFITELKNCAIIREVHVYGKQVVVGKVSSQKKQHSGFGTRLIEKAEEICRANGYKKLAIIAGIGTREYYKKRGYKLKGTYMIKDL